MTHDDDREFWRHAPHVLDDPFGWASAWWRRLRNVAIALEILGFAIFAGVVIWRLTVHGEFSEAPLEVALMVGLAITLAIQAALRRRNVR